MTSPDTIKQEILQHIQALRDYDAENETFDEYDEGWLDALDNMEQFVKGLPAT